MLIITIIVVIILAAVVILTLSKNNPIESAKEARFKEDVRTFQDDLSMYISKDYAKLGGARDYKITATGYEKDESSSDYANSVYKYIPSYKTKYDGKFIIKNDELMYKEGKVVGKELEWCQNLGIKEKSKTGAERAKEAPSEYYGKEVSYITGNEGIDSDITSWKIFYSDGSNVYIISSNYVNPTYLPEKDNAKPARGDATNYPRAARFNNILSKYSGSADITDEKMKGFNSDYFDKNYSSGDNNMKSVAYMLDKDIWKNFVNSSVAEYAVGGPSVEMLMKSYSEKKNVDYRAKAVNNNGYQISQDGGENWNNRYEKMLSTNEDLYVLPQSSTGSGSDAMWLASPSANNGVHVLYVLHNGFVAYTAINGYCRVPTFGMSKF